MVQSDSSNDDGTEVPDMAVTDLTPAPHPLDTEAARLAETMLPAGTKVEVRRRFDAKWSKGFVVSGMTRDGYLVRRPSDGEELPVIIDAEDVRKERKNNTWWY